MTSLLDKIKIIDWYRQETEATPYFIYMPCRGCLTFFKTSSRVVYYCTTDNCRAYFDKEFLRQQAEAYLGKEKKWRGFLDGLFNQWVKICARPNQKLFRELDVINARAVSDRALLKLHRRLVDRAFLMWNQFFMDFYDIDAEGLVERELVAAGITLTDQERAILMKQERLITHQRAERDLLKIVSLIKDTSGAVNIFLDLSNPANLHRLALYPKIQRALVRHQQRYFWIHNGWSHTSMLGEWDFVEMIKEILSGPRRVAEEWRALENFEVDILRMKKNLARRHRFSPWLRALFHFFAVLAFWRDERKVQVQQMNHYLQMLGTEIARRSGLTWSDIRVCDPRAIASIPISSALVKKYQEQFTKRHIFVWNGKQIAHLSPLLSARVADTIEKIMQKAVTEIRGTIACPGKARGRVAIIGGESQFKKMRDGAVLVTPMTRPEFVPLMRRAAAIVTDEGGITSHAAVVARELNIPCIIGTKVASKKLRDGDTVLVNADHGVVIVED